jgi:transcriptional regulator with XRE-family HTH domain
MADNRVGTKIRTLRESLGLSVDQLAERCNCEPQLIESLEAGDFAPSIEPLIKITRALGVRLGTLLDDETTIGPVVTRSGAAPLVTRFKGPGGGSTAELDFFSLAGAKASKHMDPFVISLSGGEVESLSSHEGEEFIYVLSGGVEVAYGKDVHALAQGDSIYYDSIVPHQVRCVGSECAQILAVVYAPF